MIVPACLFMRQNFQKGLAHIITSYIRKQVRNYLFGGLIK